MRESKNTSAFLHKNDILFIIDAYKLLGNIYDSKKDYENSMKCYKNILKYSWILERTDIELETYDNLSTKYFLLGKINKSQVYHSKYMRGIVEPKDSSIR